MKLSSVLANIKGSGEEKTASVSSLWDQPGTVKAAGTGERLKQALREATTQVMEKQASAESPVAALMKTASMVAGAEHEALVKEAHLYGTAVCDGFMVRLAQYNEAAEKIASQQGSVKTAADGSFEKFAAENPSLVKEAAELGYNTTMGQMEKLAENAYEQGYNETVSTIYKLAHDSFVQGFENAGALIMELRK